MKEKKPSKKSEPTNAEISVQEAKDFAAKMIVNNPYFESSHLMDLFLRQVQTGNNPDANGICGHVAMESLEILAHKVRSGDTGPIEDVLFGQLKWLEQLAFIEAANMSRHTKLEPVLAIGYFVLRIQEQARKTAATLAAIRQGPRNTTFIKQQNQAVVQQVNHSENISAYSANKVMEVENERMDRRAEKKEVGAHSAIEALDAEYRAENAKRESASLPERTETRAKVNRND